MIHSSNQITHHRKTSQFNGFFIVSFTLLIAGFTSLLVVLDTQGNALTAVAAPLEVQSTPTNTPFQPNTPTESPVWNNTFPPSIPSPPPPDTSSDDIFAQIRLPYNDYTFTQGIHGSKYGDAAIDLTAGKGMAILSPIYGVVTKNGLDEWGNTALIIENDNWKVKLLHGDYFNKEGDWVRIGQVVGRENNRGYTYDLWGQSCKKRDCGYHTHFNVFDKRLGENANIIELLHP